VRERVFDWESCKRLIAAAMVIIRRNQAPHRDAEISAGWRELRDAMDEFSAWKDGAATVFCKALRFLLDAVCLLRIDAANARLRLISPIVSSNGVEYERRQFEEKLGAGKLTLERATVSLCCFVFYFYYCLADVWRLCVCVHRPGSARR